MCTAFLWPIRFGQLLFLSLYMEIIFVFFLNVRPFDYAAFVVSGKVKPV